MFWITKDRVLPALSTAVCKTSSLMFLLLKKPHDAISVKMNSVTISFFMGVL